MALLELQNVSKHFGKLAALSNVSLEVERGEFVGLVGPNGSGKTTLFNVVSGFYSPSGGKVYYNGEDITGLRPDKITSKGLVRTFQSNILYKEATALENLVRASYLHSNTSSWKAFFNSRDYRENEKAIFERAEAALAHWGLEEVRDVLADELPHGHQRRLGLAVAVAADPELLLLDEPLAGMSGEERLVVMEQVRELSNQGMTIILVEHHVKTVLNLCERLLVLDYGIKIADGKPEEVTCQKTVVQAYLGAEEVVDQCS